MKKTLIKVLSSAMALSLVIASASIAATPSKTVATPKATAKTAVAEKAEINVIREGGVFEAIEAKAKAEIPVVFEAAAPEAKLAKAAPEVEIAKAEPEVRVVKAEPAEESVEAPAIPEITAEPDMVWDVSATEFDDVAMAFYSDPVSSEIYIAEGVTLDQQTGTVYIRGTGEMSEALYKNFMTVESYTLAVKNAFEKYYGAEVELIYDETLTDVIEIDSTLMVKNARTGEYLIATPEMMEQINFADFLVISPERIVVDEGITNVSEYAFLACADVKEIVIGNTVETIAPSAFQQCKGLEKVILPEGITIDNSAFYKCDSLKTIIVADEAYYANYANGIEANSACRTLSLDDINALIDGEPVIVAKEVEPAMVWDISATANDNVLMEYYTEPVASTEVRLYPEADAVVISGEGAMEESVYKYFMSVDKYISVTKALFEEAYGVPVYLEYDETITDVVELDKTIKYYSCVTDERLFHTQEILDNINPADFLKYSPSTIIIEEGITNVSDFAFLCCNELVDVVLPSTIESIGEYAFEFCTGLRRVVIPENAKISYGSFSSCTALESVEIVTDNYYKGIDPQAGEEDTSVRYLTADEIAALINDGR